MKGEQDPAPGEKVLRKHGKPKTRRSYLQSDRGQGDEGWGGKLGRFTGRYVPLPSARGRPSSRMWIRHAHRQLYYSLARSHEATHLSLSYIYSCSSERAQMKQSLFS